MKNLIIFLVISIRALLAYSSEIPRVEDYPYFDLDITIVNPTTNPKFIGSARANDQTSEYETIVIPSRILSEDNEIEITSILDFYGQPGIKKLVIEKSVEDYLRAFVGPSAFRNCENLDSVIGLSSCKEYAFADCPNLRYAQIDLDVANDKSAFQYSGIFKNDSSLEYVEGLQNILDNKTPLESMAFENCQNLSYDSLHFCANLSDRVFYNCDRIKNVSIGKCFLEEGDNGYSNHYNVGKECFAESDSIQKVYLGDYITVKKKAFYNCKNLKDLYIGPWVEFEGDSIFYQCDSLKNIYFTSLYRCPNVSIDDEIFSTDSINLFIPNHLIADILGTPWERLNLIPLFLTEEDWTTSDKTLEIDNEFQLIGNRIILKYPRRIEIFDLSGKKLYDVTSEEFEVPHNGIFIIKIESIEPKKVLIKK